MKKVTVLLFVFCMSAGLVAGQSDSKETRNLKGFSRVNFGISGNLNIKIGPEYSVVLEGVRGDLSEVRTEISGDKLIIKQENWRFNFDEKVNVYITMPELKGLGVSGSGKAEVLDPVKTQDLDLNVSGSGKLYMSEIEVNNLDCGISGSGNISLASGTVINADVSISGSGSLAGVSAKVEKMDISISGSGSCTCYVTGSLDASISGSGNVSYKGNPSIDARSSGSGHVRSIK